MNLLMISLGNDVSLGKGERTIQRHLTYAEYSKINIHMILLSPIKNKQYQKLITRNKVFPNFKQVYNTFKKVF